jgi:aspartate/methionine/tyrosine aminotransferase
MFSKRTEWPLARNRLSRALEARRRAGRSILDLTESNPTRCGFEYDRGKILGALSDPRSLTYSPDPRGLASARRAVADYYAERDVCVSPEQVFLTTSTSEAYAYVFRLLADPGDNVLVPAPSYPLFEFLGGLNDLELAAYPLLYDQGWQVDLQALNERIGARTRAILLVHPNNPTGSFVSRRELDFLADRCSERGLALVADEVFSDYAFAPGRVKDPGLSRVTTHADERRALTFTLSGLSKVSALPQMKLAWIIVSGPAELLERAMERMEVIADTYLSTSAPLALALPSLLESRRELQPQILERVRWNLSWLDNQFDAASKLSRLTTEGGWYVVLKVPSIKSDEDWAVELVSEEGVFLHPGHFFDFATEGFLVASLVPSADVFEEGMRRVFDRVAHSI